jgi:hypothetical protein
VLAAAAYLRDTRGFSLTTVFAAIIIVARYLAGAGRMLAISVFISHTFKYPFLEEMNRFEGEFVPLMLGRYARWVKRVACPPQKFYFPHILRSFKARF